MSPEESIRFAIDKLKKTDWGKTPKGQKVIEALKQLESKGRIVVRTQDRDKLAHYRLGKITVNKMYCSNGFTMPKLMAALAHEGIHYLQIKGGDLLYDFEDEREAYDVTDEVYADAGLQVERKSDSDIRWEYKGAFEHAKWWYDHTGGLPGKIETWLANH